MGYITVFLSDTVLGVSKSIGVTPITKFRIQQGNYNLIYRKDGFLTQKQKVDVKGNQENFYTVNLTAKILTKITSEPSEAAIQIDDVFKGYTPFKDSLGLGEHEIKIKKHNYETLTKTISVVDLNDGWSDLIVRKPNDFKLKPKDYVIDFSSRPKNAEFYVNGIRKGTVDSEQHFEYSETEYSILLKKKNYFDKKFKISVSENSPKSYHKNLMFDKYFNLNYINALGYYGGEIGGYYKRFSLAIDYFIAKNKHTKFDFDSLSTDNPPSQNSIYYSTDFILDSKYFFEEDGYRVVKNAPNNHVFSLKIGMVILKPFVFRLHAGYGWSNDDSYKVKVYKYVSSYPTDIQNGKSVNSTIEVYYGDLVFNEVPVKPVTVQTFLVGISIPIFKYGTIKADYWFKTYEENTSGNFVLGVGLGI